MGDAPEEPRLPYGHAAPHRYVSTPNDDAGRAAQGGREIGCAILKTDVLLTDMNEKEFYTNVGALIRERRRMRDLTQGDFAVIMDTTANTISRWETGTYRPSAYDLYRLADYFKIAPREFYSLRLPTKRAKGKR